jgi:hypothetical protein
MADNWRAGRDSRASFARLRNEAKLRREPPTLRFEAGFGGFQETPEIKDFGHLARIA